VIAIQLGPGTGLDRLQQVQLPDPGDPGPGEIRVRLHATSLNFHDYRVATASTATGRIPMADGAGVVESVGAGVSEFGVGDHVISLFFTAWTDGTPPPVGLETVPGDGIDGYAREAVVAPASFFTPAPPGYSHAEAATIPTAGVTAWRSLVVDAGIKRDDVVLVLGTGGVSIFALQIAVALGATVVVTSSSDDKLERAREMGAAHTINYRQVPGWGQAVLDWTGGRGVDCVVETAGAGTLAESMTAVRSGGLISVIGALTGAAVPFDLMPVLFKQVRLQGLLVGTRRHQEECVRDLAAHSIRPVIDKVFPLTGLADAFRYQESGQHFGKICAAW
jgi:NADPH:quinone reductase-like Zn-dependent oxidoreductase